MLDDQPVQSDDLAQLGDAVYASAIVLDNGEILWPFDNANDAIDALAHLGRVVRGVDARERDDVGIVTEVSISDYHAADVEAGRQQAREAVARAEEITGWTRPLILLTW